MQLGVQSKIKTRMTNCVDPDETANNEPSHLDLLCIVLDLVCRAERVN